MRPRMVHPSVASMADSKPRSGPAVYRIRVRGCLDPQQSGRFEGLSISESPGDGSGPETILVGRLLDQADLAGVLATLFDLRLPVIAVECLADG